MRSQLYASVVASFFMASSAQSLPIDLGDAAGFNGFFRDGFQSGPNDSQGALAAGGDVSLTGYTVNTLGQQSVPALVAGGSVTQVGGDINGNVVAGGSYSASAGGSVHSGNVVQNSSALPVDFQTTFAQLDQLSQALVPFGTSTALDAGKLTFSGDGSAQQQVFNIDGSDLTSAWGLFAESMTQDQEVVINVSGSVINLDAGDYLMKDSAWAWIGNAEHVLFNFYEAETIYLSGAFHGTLLATEADIVANGGSVDGQVIANSWQGQTQLNAPLFAHHQTVAVPEPTSVMLLVIGLAGLLLMRRRSKS